MKASFFLTMASQSIGDLKAMVMEVNATQVDPVDRLSDDSISL